jgi:Radical SAM superfamily
LGLTVTKSGLFAVKSNDSIELSTGCRESLGAGLALPSGRTQAFHLYRYFTDRALGSDYGCILGCALCMPTKNRGKIIMIPQTPLLVDTFGRRIEYLRLSVTDRCDLRCSYCIPKGFRGFQEPASWLRFEEIERLISIMAPRGLKRVRLTGGEPLVRRDLPDLAARLAAIPGIDDLSLSTNATRLHALAAPLKEAGVRRVNVSLDSLRADRVAASTLASQRQRRGDRGGTSFGDEPKAGASRVQRKARENFATHGRDGRLTDCHHDFRMRNDNAPCGYREL